MLTSSHELHSGVGPGTSYFSAVGTLLLDHERGGCSKGLSANGFPVGARFAGTDFGGVSSPRLHIGDSNWMKVFFTDTDGTGKLLKCRRPGGAGLDSRPELCSLAPRSWASRSDMCLAGDGDRATQAGVRSPLSTSTVTPTCSCNGCSRLGVFKGVPWGKRPRDGSKAFACSAMASVQSSCPLLHIGEEKQFSASILAGVKCTSLLLCLGERNEPSTRIPGFLDGHKATS
mmetsp:Transcript_46726/g.93016  ORF Transcript_46726/g.93016 Transcript_46726/m.93016 type:complete len:230 (+) Transcript_46726:937-1626(+)